jgi:hypothetical protein
MKYYIEFDSGSKFHSRKEFNRDEEAIKYYDRWYFDGYKLYKEISIGKFELVIQRKRKRHKYW